MLLMNRCSSGEMKSDSWMKENIKYVVFNVACDKTAPQLQAFQAAILSALISIIIGTAMFKSSILINLKNYLTHTIPVKHSCGCARISYKFK